MDVDDDSGGSEGDRRPTRANGRKDKDKDTNSGDNKIAPEAVIDGDDGDDCDDDVVIAAVKAAGGGGGGGQGGAADGGWEAATAVAAAAAAAPRPRKTKAMTDDELLSAVE